MWIMFVFAGMLSIFVANSFYTEYMQREIPWNATEAASDVGKFHAFAAAAELFMRDHADDSMYLPGGATAVYWKANGTVKGLKEAKGLPPGLVNANIDSTWRIHIVDSGYVLCTGMSMGGVVSMARLPNSPFWNPAIAWRQANTSAMNAGTLVEMVTFDVDATSAQTLCK